MFCLMLKRDRARQFYRPLPNIVNNPWQIFRFAVKGFEKNIGGIFLVGIIATLLGMIVPQATALLVNRAIRDRDLGLLWQLGLGLLAMALGKTAFSLSQGFIALRVETASTSTLQVGVWDKLLRLSPTFFRKYSSGDLLNRVLSIKQIYQIVSVSLKDKFLEKMNPKADLIRIKYGRLQLFFPHRKS